MESTYGDTMMDVVVNAVKHAAAEMVLLHV